MAAKSVYLWLPGGDGALYNWHGGVQPNSMQMACNAYSTDTYAHCHISLPMWPFISQTTVSWVGIAHRCF